MKIRVISEFYDKFHTSTLFKVGTVLDFDDERAKDIISKRLGEKVEETPVKVEEPKAEETIEETVVVTAEPAEETAAGKEEPVIGTPVADEGTESVQEAVVETHAEEAAEETPVETPAEEAPTEPRKSGRPKKEKAD